MVTLNINFDLSSVQELQQAIQKFGKADKNILPATSAAFGASGELVKRYLANYLAGGKLDGIRELTDQEISSIRGTKVESRQTGDFAALVTAENQRLEKLVTGTPDVEYDMKKTHPYGLKSRVSKKGIPYLIIPFRWGTPNSKGTKRRWNNVIDQKTYRTIIKAFEMSSVKKTTHVEANFKGQAIDRAEYTWKNRLSEDDSWDDRATGMVRMMNGTKSTYFTFRIISAESPEDSWIYHRKGNPGVDILGAIERTSRSQIEKIIEAGLKADLGIQ